MLKYWTAGKVTQDGSHIGPISAGRRLKRLRSQSKRLLAVRRCTMSARDIPRRLFLGNAAGALAFRPSHTAQADTTFTNFRFAATGAPAARTMPDRLSDIVNVKDWGAVGNGSTNDESSIQNAIDYVAGKGGGRGFFPTGTYNLKGPNHGLKVGWTSDVRIELIGTGKFFFRVIVWSGAFGSTMAVPIGSYQVVFATPCRNTIGRLETGPAVQINSSGVWKAAGCSYHEAN
jgi:polygalacturonase